jgi:hypothetical protein
MTPHSLFKFALASFALTLLHGTTYAQTTPENLQTATSTPQVTTTALQFNSVFDNYKSFRNENIGSWRGANDTVTQIGGWREYLKEAQRLDVTESDKSAPSVAPAASTPLVPPAPRALPATPKPNPHAGHGAKQ